jgi:hypothetical protein
MPRRALLAFLLLLAAAGPVAWAAGFGSDSPPSRIPTPARDFRMVVEDHGGTVIEVTKASFNGEVFLYGTLGSAQVTVPFENITTVVFERAEAEDERIAVVTDPKGEQLRITVEDDVPCYGRTAFGNLRIDVGDLRRLTMKGRVATETP